MEPRSLAPNARAAVSTAVCTLLAVAAHRSMSAVAIPTLVMVLGGAAVFCFARIAAALGERGLGAIALLVGGSQVGLHLLFQAGQAASMQSGAPSMTSMASMTGMASMPGMPEMSSAAGMPGMPSTSSPSSLLGTAAGMPSASSPSSLLGTAAGMTIAHVLAALVTAWWLRRGEAALFAAVERTRAVLGSSWRMLAWWIAGARPMRPTGSATCAVGPDGGLPTVARVLLSAVIRRGPPAAFCR